MIFVFSLKNMAQDSIFTNLLDLKDYFDTL